MARTDPRRRVIHRLISERAREWSRTPITPEQRRRLDERLDAIDRAINTGDLPALERAQAAFRQPL